MQDCGNSNASALELPQFCAKPFDVMLDGCVCDEEVWEIFLMYCVVFYEKKSVWSPRPEFACWKHWWSFRDFTKSSLMCSTWEVTWKNCKLFAAVFKTQFPQDRVMERVVKHLCTSDSSIQSYVNGWWSTIGVKFFPKNAFDIHVEKISQTNLPCRGRESLTWSTQICNFFRLGKSHQKHTNCIILQALSIEIFISPLMRELFLVNP